MSNVGTFGNEHILKPISVTQLVMNWNTTKAQTAGEGPHFRAKWLITGNMPNTGMKQNRLIKNNLFNPTRRITLGNNSPCVVPFSNPKIPRHDPIAAGDMPNPPRWMGVAKKRG